MTQLKKMLKKKHKNDWHWIDTAVQLCSGFTSNPTLLCKPVLSPTFTETPSGSRTAAPEALFSLFGLLIPTRTQRCCIRAEVPRWTTFTFCFLNEQQPGRTAAPHQLLRRSGLTANRLAFILSWWEEELLDLCLSLQLPQFHCSSATVAPSASAEALRSAHAVTKPRSAGSWLFPPPSLPLMTGHLGPKGLASSSSHAKKQNQNVTVKTERCVKTAKNGIAKTTTTKTQH